MTTDASLTKFVIKLVHARQIMIPVPTMMFDFFQAALNNYF